MGLCPRQGTRQDQPTNGPISHFHPWKLLGVSCVHTTLLFNVTQRDMWSPGLIVPRQTNRYNVVTHRHIHKPHIHTHTHTDYSLHCQLGQAQ